MATDSNTVKRRLLDIFANYHSPFVSNSSDSNDKYYIDTDNEKSFDNLITLISNTEFKTIDEYEKAETAISGEFGKMLVKYCELGLSNDDIFSLLQIVYMYNSKMSALFTFGEYEKFGDIGDENYNVPTLLRYCFEAIPDENGIMTSTSDGGYYARLVHNISRCFMERKFYENNVKIESDVFRVLTKRDTATYEYKTASSVILYFNNDKTFNKSLDNGTTKVPVSKSDIWNLYFTDLHGRKLITDFEFGVFSHMNALLIKAKTTIKALMNASISADPSVTTEDFLKSVDENESISDYVKSVSDKIFGSINSIALSTFKSDSISLVDDYYWTYYSKSNSGYSVASDGWSHVTDEDYISALVSSMNECEKDYMGLCGLYYVIRYVEPNAEAAVDKTISSTTNLFESLTDDRIVSPIENYDSKMAIEVVRAANPNVAYNNKTIAGISKDFFIFSQSSNKDGSFLTDDNGNVVFVSTGSSDKADVCEIPSSSFFLCDYMTDPFATKSNGLLRFRKTKYSFFLYDISTITDSLSGSIYFNSPTDLILANLKFYLGSSSQVFNEILGKYRLGLRKINDGINSTCYDQSTYFTKVDAGKDAIYSIKMTDEGGNVKFFSNKDMPKVYWSICYNYSENGNTDSNYKDTEFSDVAALGPEYVTPNPVLSRGVSSLYEMALPNAYSEIRKNALSIIYDFTAPTSIGATVTKVTDEDISKYGTQQYQSILKLTNIPINSNDLAYSDRMDLIASLIASKGYAEDVKTDLVEKTTSTSADATTTSYFSIFILYKELNQKYREAEESALSEMLFASYYHTKKRNLAYSYLVPEYRTYSDTAIMSSDNIEIVRDTYTNPYNARVGKKFDVISYKSGDAIGYGEDSTEEKEIETFLQLYTETRNYFYNVQFNKAFALDDMYDFYSLMYIIGFSIDRWYSKKLSSFRNVDTYDINDCSKFFASYGLSEVSAALEDSSAAFYDRLDYCKKIISNYSELIKYKGSKKVVNLLSSIFYNDSTKISITKYLIFHDMSAGEAGGNGEIKFIEVGYDESNAPAVISNEINHAKGYDDTISDDVYWNGKVTEDEVKALDMSPQTTKYIGITAENDISKKFIKTRYTVSMMEYLRDKTYSSDSAVNAITNPLYKIKEEVTLNVGNTSEKLELNICTLIEMGEMMMAIYHHLQDSLEKSNTRAMPPKEKTGSISKYYGINGDISGEDLIISITGSDSSSYDKTSIYSYLHGNLSTGIPEMLETADYYYSDYSLKEGSWSTEMTNQIGNIDQSYKNKDFYFIPLHDTNSSKTEEYALAKADSRFLDYFDELHTANVNATDRLTSVESISSILGGSSLMTLLNSVSGTDGTYIKKRFYKLNALYLYDKTVSNSSSAVVYSNVGELVSSTELSLSSTIGGTVITAALEFPNDYLYGTYEERNSTKATPVFINKTVKDYLNGIFDNLYLKNTAPFAYKDSYAIGNDLYKTFNMLESDSAAMDGILDFMLEGIYTRSADDIYSITDSLNPTDENDVSISAITIAMSTLEDRILTLDGYLSDMLSGISTLDVQYSISEESDDLLSFIVKLIKEFMSYTTSVKNVSTNNVYDNESETVPYAFSFAEDVSNSANESLYYDEKISMILTKNIE